MLTDNIELISLPKLVLHYFRPQNFDQHIEVTEGDRIQFKIN